MDTRGAGGIIEVMRALIDGRPRVLGLVASAVLVAVVAWMALASGSASSNQVGIEVTSPQGVATFEGEMRRPW